MNKAELLAQLDSEREKFLDLIESLPFDSLETPGVSGEWSVKDILAHLSRWEAELVKLLWQAPQGLAPSSAQFSKLPVDEINRRWFEESRGRSLERVLEDFHAVRNQTQMRLESFTDRDLTDSKRYSWLKGRALWEWIAEDSFWHEAEHAIQIQEWREKSGY